MTEPIVLDSSAILALLYGEPGAAMVKDVLTDSSTLVYISAVNLCEVGTKLVHQGATRSQIRTSVEPFAHYLVSFDTEQSMRAAELTRMTKALGLSLGDRACLALAFSKDATVWTTDRAWLKVEAGVRIELIRD